MAGVSGFLIGQRHLLLEDCQPLKALIMPIQARFNDYTAMFTSCLPECRPFARIKSLLLSLNLI